METTLLDLIWKVQEEAESDAETVAVVWDMLLRGEIKLNGSFRGAPLSVFSP